MTILDIARELLADSEAAAEGDMCLMRRDEVIAICRALIARTEALRAMTERYVRLVNSGDAGYWNPEEERDVIAARRALSEPEQQSNTGD